MIQSSFLELYNQNKRGDVGEYRADYDPKHTLTHTHTYIRWHVQCQCFSYSLTLFSLYMCVYVRERERERERDSSIARQTAGVCPLRLGLECP